MNYTQKLIQISSQFSIRTKLIFSKYPKIDFENEKFQPIDIKPYGLWYSWGNVWLDFLWHKPNENQKSWFIKRAKEYKHIYKITVNQDNLLRLRTTKDFMVFTKKYGIPCKECQYKYKKDLSMFTFQFVINWQKVAKDFSGIDIMYNDKLDEVLWWYNGWDCSSGCVWNSKAIKNIVKIH